MFLSMMIFKEKTFKIFSKFYIKKTDYGIDDKKNQIWLKFTFEFDILKWQCIPNTNYFVCKYEKFKAYFSKSSFLV